MKTTLIIPARYSSARFPGKVLARICGKPLIQHVFERANMVSLADNVIVATDDKRVLEEVRSFGGDAILTSPYQRTGSDRVSEVALRIDADIIIDLQGDEILLDPDMVDELITLFKDKRIEMGTIKREIRTREELYNTNIVKVVTDREGFALYFSRAPIPFTRDLTDYDPLPQKRYYRHIGIYGYRRELLLKFSRLPVSLLEEAEKLEQLRILEDCYKIKVIETKGETLRIDTQEDLKGAEGNLMD